MGRSFGNFFRDAGELIARPDLAALAKRARDSRHFTTDDLLEAAATIAVPQSDLTRVGGQIGHPRYQDLPFGQTHKADAAVLFLDIRGFTRLSIELENEELIRILQKLSIASVATVYKNGGFIGDFTGDGIMAFFDGTDLALSSLRTAADLLSGVRDVVNPALKRDGDTGIRVAAGLEFGEVCWTRIGYAGISQVKPVSEVTYVAGKLATRKHTDRWECAVGEQLAAIIPENFRKRTEGIAYNATNSSKTYSVFSIDWEKFDQYLDQHELNLRRGAGQTLKVRDRRATPPLSSALRSLSGILGTQSRPVPGPADAPVPPKNRQVG
jgi:class 3 adenylate cyclase